MQRRVFLSLPCFLPIAVEVLAPATTVQPQPKRGDRYVQAYATWDLPPGENIAFASFPIRSVDDFGRVVATVRERLKPSPSILDGYPIRWQVNWGNGNKDKVRFTTRLTTGTGGPQYLAWDGKDNGRSASEVDEFQAIQRFLPAAVFEVLKYGRI